MESKAQQCKNKLFPIENFTGIFQQLILAVQYATQFITDQKLQQQYFNILVTHLDPILFHQNQINMLQQENQINIVAMFFQAFFILVSKSSSEIIQDSYIRRLLEEIQERMGLPRLTERRSLRQGDKDQIRRDDKYKPFDQQPYSQSQVQQINNYQLLWCLVLTPFVEKNQEFILSHKSMLVQIFNTCQYVTNNDDYNQMLPYNECFNRVTGTQTNKIIKTPFASIVLQKPIDNLKYIFQTSSQIKIELLTIILLQKDINNDILKQFMEQQDIQDENLSILITALTYAYLYCKVDTLSDLRKIVCFQQKSIVLREKCKANDQTVELLKQIMIKTKLIEKTQNATNLSIDTVKNFTQLLIITKLWLQMDQEQYTNIILFLLKYLEFDSIYIIESLIYPVSPYSILSTILMNIITGKQQIQQFMNQQQLNLKKLQNFDAILQNLQQETLYFQKLQFQKYVKLSVLIKVLTAMLQKQQNKENNQETVFLAILCQIFTGQQMYIDNPLIKLINQTLNPNQSVLDRIVKIKEKLNIFSEFKDLKSIQDYIQFIKTTIGEQNFKLLLSKSQNLEEYGYFNTIILAQACTETKENQQEYIEIFASINFPIYIAKYLSDEIQEQVELNNKENVINTLLPQIPLQLLEIIFTLRPKEVSRALNEQSLKLLNQQQHSSSYNQFSSQWTIQQLLVNCISLSQQDFNQSDDTQRRDFDSYRELLLEIINQCKSENTLKDNEISELLIEYIIKLTLKFQNQLQDRGIAYVDEIDKIYKILSSQCKNERIIQAYQQLLQHIPKSKLSEAYTIQIDLSQIQQVQIQDITELVLCELDQNLKTAALIALYKTPNKFDQLSYLATSFYLQKQPKNEYNVFSILNDLKLISQQLTYMSAIRIKQLKEDEQYVQALIQTLQFILYRAEFQDSEFYYQVLLITKDILITLVQQDNNVRDILKALCNQRNLQKIFSFSLKLENLQKLSLQIVFISDPIIYLQTAIENTFLLPNIADKMFTYVGNILQICESEHQTVYYQEFLRSDTYLDRLILLQKPHIYKILFEEESEFSNPNVQINSIIASLYLARSQNKQQIPLYAAYFMDKINIKYNKNLIFNEMNYKDYIERLVEYMLHYQKSKAIEEIQIFIQFLCQQQITIYISELIYYILRSIPAKIKFIPQVLDIILHQLKHFSNNTQIDIINILLTHPLQNNIIAQGILPILYQIYDKGNEQIRQKVLYAFEIIYEHQIDIEQPYLQKLIRFKLQQNFTQGVQILMQENEEVLKQIIQELEKVEDTDIEITQQYLQQQFIKLYDKII